MQSIRPRGFIKQRASWKSVEVMGGRRDSKATGGQPCRRISQSASSTKIKVFPSDQSMILFASGRICRTLPCTACHRFVSAAANGAKQVKTILITINVPILRINTAHTSYRKYAPGNSHLCNFFSGPNCTFGNPRAKDLLKTNGTLPTRGPPL